MPKKSREKALKKAEAKKECWYYDACALNATASVKEITNGKMVSILSHLAVGEAVSNEYRKGLERGRTFVEILELMTEAANMKYVGHDEGAVTRYFYDVRDEFPALSLTDAIHVATAIKHKCKVLKTSDGDLCNEEIASGIKKYVKSKYGFDLKVSTP